MSGNQAKNVRRMMAAMKRDAGAAGEEYRALGREKARKRMAWNLLREKRHIIHKRKQ